MECRRYDPVDRLIGQIDLIIKNLNVPPDASRAIPTAAAAGPLTESDRAESARLMRVNHAGEVAAQALYQGQALTARNPEVRTALHQAAAEEADHLAWCEERLKELRGHPSLLKPLWYLGSLSLGAIAGAFGDRISLGFLAETEKQVESHLQDHLERMSPADTRSRAILTQMSHDEAGHGAKATAMGGKALPFPITWAMRATARLMTLGAYWI